MLCPSTQSKMAVEQNPLVEFCQVVIEDLSMLIILHDKEPNTELISALRECGFPSGLGLKLDSEQGRLGCDLIHKAIVGLPDPVDRDALNELAVDYADIYLIHHFRVSPLESVWTDEEQLTCQAAMLELRDYYRHHGFAAEDWRRRPEDHLVVQISFIVQLLQRSPSEATLLEVAGFLDRHLLRWLPEFAERVAGRCSTAFFAGVCLLTSAYMETLRDVLAKAFGIVRLQAAEIVDNRPGSSAAEQTPSKFIPGTGPTV